MKIHRVLASTLFTGLLAVGCSNKDFTSKSLQSHLGNPGTGQCPTPTSIQQAGSKVRIAETAYGEASILEAQASLPVSSSRELVIVVDEKCVSEKRKHGAESALTENLRFGSRLHRERSHLLKLHRTVTVSNLVYEAEGDDCVSIVGENVIATISAAPNDPMLNQQKHLPNIKASQAYDVFYNAQTGIQENVIIAVIDSGVDLAHEDLRDNLWVNAGEVPNNGVDDDGNGYVDDVNGYNFVSRNGNPNPQPWTGQYAGAETHGTHVSGLAAAKSNNGIGVAGVNGEKARIMALNVFGNSPGASTPNIDEAIRYAADKGANVINMSLGGQGQAESTAQAMRYAVGKGVVIIVAAGNDNKDINTNFFTPASYGSTIQGMLAIGAIDSATSGKCSFSNFNTTRVEMGAPGCNGLYATVIGNRYQSLQGTSMASPVTAGAASLAFGLIKARTGVNPTPAVVEEVMKAGSRVESGLTTYFREGRTVDLVALATEINTRYSGAVPPPPPPPDDGCD